MKQITPPSVRAAWREWFTVDYVFMIDGANGSREVNLSRIVRELLQDIAELEREIKRLKDAARNERYRA